MWGGLRDVFDEGRRQPRRRVLVITGAGKGFCAGADLVDSGMPVAPVDALAHARRRRSAGRVAQHRQATIARVNGVAAGAGLTSRSGATLVIGVRRRALQRDLRVSAV